MRNEITLRERYEAVARSVRDILSQRWIQTEHTYERENPKRIYYFSIELLLGRSLRDNIANLMLDPVAAQLIKDKNLDWTGLLEQEPDPGLGNGGLGTFGGVLPGLDGDDAVARDRLRAALRIRDVQAVDQGWLGRKSDRTIGCGTQIPGKSLRLQEAVEVKLNCSFEMSGGSLRAELVSRRGCSASRAISRSSDTAAEPSIHFACGPPRAPDYFDFQEFSHGDFVGALAEKLAAETLTRVLYPDDSTSLGQGLRFIQEYFLVACSLADIIRRFRRSNADWNSLPDKAAIQLNDTHPAIAVSELMRILLDDAKLGWDQAWDLTRRTLGYTNHTLLPEALEKWPVDWFEW